MSREKDKSNSDKKAFLEAMKGVRPLSNSHKKRVVTKTNPKAIDKTARALQKAAENFQEKNSQDGFAHLEPIDANEILIYKSKHCPHQESERLERGHFTIQASLDLHKLRVLEAERALRRFITDCAKQKRKSLLIIHGKGSGRLKALTNQFLKGAPEVKAFCSAKNTDGGTGAVYVLISCLL